MSEPRSIRLAFKIDTRGGADAARTVANDFEKALNRSFAGLDRRLTQMFRIGARGFSRMFSGVHAEISKLLSEVNRLNAGFEKMQSQLARIGGSNVSAGGFRSAMRTASAVAMNQSMSQASRMDRMFGSGFGRVQSSSGGTEASLLQQILLSVRSFDANMGRAMGLLVTGRNHGGSPAGGGGPMAGVAAVGLATGAFSALRPTPSMNFATARTVDGRCHCASEINRLNATALSILGAMRGSPAAAAAAPAAARPALPPIPRTKAWRKIANEQAAASPGASTTAPEFVKRVDEIYGAGRVAAKMSRGSGAKRLTDAEQLAVLEKNVASFLGAKVQYTSPLDTDKNASMAAMGRVASAIGMAKKSAPGLEAFMKSNPLVGGLSMYAKLMNIKGVMARGAYAKNTQEIRLAAEGLDERTVLHELGHHLHRRMDSSKRAEWQAAYAKGKGAAAKTDPSYSKFEPEAFADAFARFILGPKAYKAAMPHALMKDARFSSIFTKSGALSPKINQFFKAHLGDDADLLPDGEARKKYRAKVPAADDIPRQYFSMLDSFADRAKGGSDVRGEQNLLNHLRRYAGKGGRQSDRFESLLRFGLRRQQGTGGFAEMGAEPWKQYQGRLQRFVDAAGGDEAVGLANMQAHMRRVIQLNRRNAPKYSALLRYFAPGEAAAPSAGYGNWAQPSNLIASEMVHGGLGSGSRTAYSLTDNDPKAFAMAEMARLGRRGMSTTEYEQRRNVKLSDLFAGPISMLRRVAGWARRGRSSGGEFDLMAASAGGGAGAPPGGGDPWSWIGGGGSGGRGVNDWLEAIHRRMAALGKLSGKAFDPMLKTLQLVEARLAAIMAQLKAGVPGGGPTPPTPTPTPPRRPSLRPLTKAQVDAALAGFSLTGKQRTTLTRRGIETVSTYENAAGDIARAYSDKKGVRKILTGRDPATASRVDPKLTKASEFYRQQQFIEGWLGGATLVGQTQTPSKNAQMRTDSTYRLADGRMATYTVDHGRMSASVKTKMPVTREVEALPGLWARFVDSVRSSAPRMSSAMSAIFAPARLLEKGGRTLGDMAIRLSALHYSMTRIGRGFGAVTLGPIEQVIGATEEARQFERSVSGVVGGPRRAREFDAALYNYGNTNNTPLTRTELRDTAREMALIPQLAPRLATGTPEQAAQAAGSFSSLTQALGELDPAQGVRGALVAIREGLSGDLRSTRLRLEISPDVLASLVGKTQRDLTADPNLFLESLQKYREIYLPQSSVAERANTVGFQKQRIADQLNRGLETVGQSGVFDQITSRLKTAGDAMFEFFNGASFKRQATEISDAMGRVFDGVTGAVLSFTRELTGMSEIKEIPTGVVESIKTVINSLADFIADAPSLGAKWAQFTHDITDNMAAVFSFVGDVIQPLRDMNILPSDEYMAAVRMKRVNERQLVENSAKYSASLQDAPDSYLDGKVAAAKAASEQYRLQMSQFDSSLQTWLANDADGRRSQSLWESDPDAARQRFSRRNELGITLPVRPHAADVAPEVLKEIERRRVLKEQLGNRADPNYYKYTPSTAAADAIGRINPDILKFVQDGQISDPGKGGPNPYGVLFTSVSGSASKIGEGYSQDQDRLFSAFQTGLLKVKELVRDRTIEEIGKQFEKDMAQISGAAGAVAIDFMTAPSNKRPAIVGQLKALASASGYIQGQYGSQRSSTIAALTQSGRNYGLGVAKSVGRESPLTRATILGQASTGTLLAQRQLADYLGSLTGSRPDFGLATLPLYEQAPMIAGLVGAEMERRSSYYAPYHAGMTSAEIRSRTVLSDRATAQQQIEYIRGSALPDASDVYDRARSVLQQNPNDVDALRAVGASAEMISDYSEQLRQLEMRLDDVGNSWRQFQTDIRESTENGLGAAISSLIKGTGDLSDVLEGFANDVINSFSRMAASNFANALFGDFGRPQGSGGVGQMGGLVSSLGSLVAGLFGGGGAPAAAAAYGGVWPGFQPVKAFGYGGMTNGPTWGVVGEAGRREGMIPLDRQGRIPLTKRGGRHFADLPDGRMIPTDSMVGGGGVTVNNHTIVVASESEAQSAASQIRGMDPEAVINIVANDMQRGGRTFKASQRKH